MPKELEDITPEDSVTPVHLVPLIEDAFVPPEFDNPQDMIAAQQSAKDSALARFAKLGFTPEEIQAITN